MNKKTAKLVVSAKLANLSKLIDFIVEGAKNAGFDEKSIAQIKLASEEIIVNVMSYAYKGGEGHVEVSYTFHDDGTMEIEITDWGVAFDPLSLPEPDVAAPLNDRKIGGLGIYLARKVMDEVRYKRVDNKNVVTLIKRP
ncbi:MAG: ATP-binding protein [Candidatus Omnitrophota bacterium]|nr:MAG: ATP-binding protein [Candidatus Omnitrophota bacterium]